MSGDYSTQNDQSNSRSPRPPTVGDDPRDHKDTNDLPGKVWFRDLDEAVIEADRCVQCGTCMAACPSNSIGVDELDGQPTLVKMCTGCSLCWDFCPRSGLRYERANAEIAARRDVDATSYAAAATDSDLQTAGQNGGAVTGLLAELLENGMIDAALVARERSGAPLDGEPMLATSRADLQESGGSFYTQTMQAGRIPEMLAESEVDDPDLAVVGTPCVITGIESLTAFSEADLGSVKLSIALMCTQSFEYDRLRSQLIEQGIDPADVESLSVVGGGLRVQTAEGETVTGDMDDFGPAALSGCQECADFVGVAADISAGTVGSPDGMSTLVTRSETGETALQQAAAGLEYSELSDTAPVHRLDSWNQQQAEDVLPREFDSEGELIIGYQEHRAQYDETDRAPASHNPARSYQYERWC